MVNKLGYKGMFLNERGNEIVSTDLIPRGNLCKRVGATMANVLIITLLLL